MSDERDREVDSGSDPKQCKIFVGGLHLQTTTESLKEYFGAWGNIVDAVVVRDPETKRSRGFGFVTFTNSQSVDSCLADRPHQLDDREVEAKRAVPKEDSNPAARTKKVFLGGLSLDTYDQDIREVLEPFGSLVDVQIMKDKNTDKPRGFGFAIFDSCDVVDKLCLKKFIRIKQRDVEVKKAISQEEMRRHDSYKQAPRYSYPSRSEPYPRSDPYAGAYRGYGGGYNEYRQMSGGYEYPRYGTTDYMRPEYMAAGTFGAMGAYSGDRAAAYAGYPGYGARGYDMSAYTSMYGSPTAMGTYPQTASTYGPARGYMDGGRDKDRGGGAMGGARTYHPYKR